MLYISFSEMLRITNDVLMKNNSFDDVEAYRIIESYLTENPIRSWIEISWLNILPPKE